MVDGRAMDHANILIAIRDGTDSRSQFSDNKLDSTSVGRLLELGVIRDVVRNECYMGSIRPSNQHRT